jgi:hypothetical protein
LAKRLLLPKFIDLYNFPEALGFADALFAIANFIIPSNIFNVTLPIHLDQKIPWDQM